MDSQDSSTIDSFLDTVVAQRKLPPDSDRSLHYDLDFHDPLCAICETGGNLVCCSGTCLRSFHSSCLGLQVLLSFSQLPSAYTAVKYFQALSFSLKEQHIKSMTSFKCADCQNKIHRCFQCKAFQLEVNLRRCKVEHCGKYYHPKVCATILSHQRSHFVLVHGGVGWQERRSVFSSRLRCLRGDRH